MAETPLLGVYSSETAGYIGAGMTRRKSVKKSYVMAWDLDGRQVLVQPLTQNMIPAGRKRLLERSEFDGRYRPEPDFFIDPRTEQVRHIWKKGEKPPAKPQAAPVAEQVEKPVEKVELDRELRIEPEEAESPAPDDATVAAEKKARLDFVLGMTHLKRGDRENAERILGDLARIKADFNPEHKHMFNEFGIGLRKNKLLDLALKHYSRARELAPGDENILHNMGRVAYEMGDLDQAVQFLEKSLELNPGLKESRQFLDFIHRKRKKRKTFKFKL